MSGTVGPRLSTIIPPFFNDYSFEFDGTDDKVITSSAIVGSDITLSGWYNLNGASYTSWQYQFATSITPSNASAPNAALGKFYKRGTQMEIAVQAYDQNSANYSAYAVRVQLEGAGWNHIVWTYNDTTKHIYCYLNGVAQTWTNYGGTITTPYLTGNALHLYGSNLIMGAISPTSTTGFFSGLLDEVSTYDRILTPSEITGIYNGGTPNDLTSLSPYGWWRNGDNSLYKYPQWLLPSNENKDKVSNYSMSFDGTDDYMSTSVSSLNSTTTFTISFWGKKTSTTKTVGLNDKVTGTNKFLLYWWSDGNVYLGARNGASNSSATFALSYDSDWHHFMGVYVGGTSLRLYVDGVLRDTITSSVPSSLSSVMGDNITIGYVDNTSYTTGNIDEVAIWNSDQSANISTISSNPLNDLTSLNPIVYYKMGENATFSTNWTVPDQIGSNDGTSANMDINDRVGNAPDSENNALSYNMVLSGRTSDVPT